VFNDPDCNPVSKCSFIVQVIHHVPALASSCAGRFSPAKLTIGCVGVGLGCLNSRTDLASAASGSLISEQALAAVFVFVVCAGLCQFSPAL
jgi:hypothetical protein